MKNGKTDYISGESELTRLAEIWSRLDVICKKLWAEDRSSAVPLQALLEEYTNEPKQIEALLESQKKTIAEMQVSLKRDYEAEYHAQIDSLQQKLEQQRSHNSAIEADLARARKECDELIRNLEAREAENLQLSENLIKNEAEKDAARAQKLQALYNELSTKSQQLEKGWDERRRDLEAEYTKKAEELRKKHEDLLSSLKARAVAIQQEYEEREGACSQKEQSAKEKEDSLSAHALELENSYQQKRTELDQLKAKLQREIADLVKNYQARSSGGA